jgi:hypothetical protein
MKRTVRLLVLTTAAAIGLAFAGSALAAYHPSLWVQQASYKLGATTGPGFLFTASGDEDATAKMTIFSPNGYAHSFASLTPGTTVGQAHAVVKANALAGALLPLDGPVVVGNPSDATLQAAAQQCTGSPVINRVLVLNTSLQGQQIQVPDFLTEVGPYVVQQICLPPPATAQFQAQVVLANFTINRVFTNATKAGGYEWAGDFTPYAGTVPNAAGTQEVRTLAALPSSITFKRVKFKFVKFVGHISMNGVGVGGKRATLFYGRGKNPAPNYTRPSKAGVEGARRAANTTPLKGNYFFVARFRVKVPTYFQMRFGGQGTNYQRPGGCTGPSPSGQPIPCAAEYLAPLTSSQVLVRPVKKKKHHH